MTPLIAELVKFVPDPELYHWFDIGQLPIDGCFVNDDQMFCLPYQRTTLVGRDSDGSKFIFSMIGGKDSVAVGGMFFVGPYPQEIQAFSYVNTDDGTRVYGGNEGPPKRAHYMPIMAIISQFLHGLSTLRKAHVPVARKSMVNSKRAAKGKGPVLFDWHTVEVAPVVAKTSQQTGSHASPRLHNRRGHWRTMRSGKRVWVRDCKVGSASRGVVFKDYKVGAPESSQTVGGTDR